MYLEIIDYVYDSSDWDGKDRKHTLSSLLQTCCLFRAFLAPRMFKSLHFNGGQAASESDNPVNPAAFCRALNNQREPAVSLAKHVQECTIADWQSDSDPSIQAIKSSFLDMYCRALRRFPNLQDLILCRVVVDDGILKTLGKLCSLNRLRLDNVDFSPAVLAADAFTWKKTSPIRTFDWRMNIFTGPDNIDVDKRAAVVTALVDTAELQYLIGSNSAQILPLLSKSPPLLSLTIGALHSTQSFWEALGGIETLETLTIRVVVLLSEEFSNHQYLPIFSLPNLQNLHIPPSLSSLAAQRRIVHLDMVHSVETEQIWGGAFVPRTLTSLPIDHFKTVDKSPRTSFSKIEGTEHIHWALSAVCFHTMYGNNSILVALGKPTRSFITSSRWSSRSYLHSFQMTSVILLPDGSKSNVRDVSERAGGHFVATFSTNWNNIIFSGFFRQYDAHQKLTDFKKDEPSPRFASDRTELGGILSCPSLIPRCWMEGRRSQRGPARKNSNGTWSEMIPPVIRTLRRQRR